MSDDVVTIGRPRGSATQAGINAAAVLCVCLGVYSAALAFGGFFIGFVSDSCGGGVACNSGVISAAVMAGVFGPPIVAVIAILIAIIRGVRRRPLAWLFPVGGGVVATMVWWAAIIVGYAAVGQNYFAQFWS